MKKFVTIALLGLALTACKKEDPNTTTVTTEEKTKVDTIGPKVRTETTITQTTETDSTEHTISSGKVEVE